MADDRVERFWRLYADVICHHRQVPGDSPCFDCQRLAEMMRRLCRTFSRRWVNRSRHQKILDQTGAALFGIFLPSISPENVLDVEQVMVKGWERMLHFHGEVFKAKRKGRATDGTATNDNGNGGRGGER